MAKPLLIRRIDLLVHPFCGYASANSGGLLYTKAQAAELLSIFESHIDEAGRDKSRLLLLTPSPVQSKSQRQLYGKLVSHARKRLGKRFGFFWQDNRNLFKDCNGIGYKTLEDFLTAQKSRIDRLSVKTRGLGEYATACVLYSLLELNRQIGMPDPIPYRNRQSTVLARKSVDVEFKPWELKELMKTAAGRKLLKNKGLAYAESKRGAANMFAFRIGKSINHFKQRKTRTRL